MASRLRAVAPANVAKPLGKYSHGIIAGNQVHLAGQLGQDPETGKIVEGGIEAQVEQIIRNIENILKEAGSDLTRIISRRNYFIDIKAHLNAAGAAWAKVLPEPYPASTAIQVGGLAIEEALLEVEVVAEIG